jgi:hypothetical protein
MNTLLKINPELSEDKEKGEKEEKEETELHSKEEEEEEEKENPKIHPNNKPQLNNLLKQLEHVLYENIICANILFNHFNHFSFFYSFFFGLFRHFSN